MHGPRMVEVHPVEGVLDDGTRDEEVDVVLVKLNECKVYLDGLESHGDPALAWQMVMLARRVKG